MNNYHISAKKKFTILTKLMKNNKISKIPQIIEFISSVMTLLPGDVILTGTPSGIGPMNPSGEVSISIEGLGTLRNKVSSRG